MVRDPWRHVAEVWNWLPAFRAVAETQHLPTAAERMGLTPSALSRAVRNLEDRLDRPLFDRVGRRIVLNGEGEVLLRSLRDAMRGVHSGLTALEGEAVAGPVRVASFGATTMAYLLPALDGLLRAHPLLEATVTTRGGATAADKLVAGHVDVAFLSLPVSDPMLEVIHLGDEPNGVWCGRRHPLFGRRDVSPDELRAWPFVAPPRGDRSGAAEGWPPHIPRRVRLEVDAMHVGVRMCRDGDALAVLPLGVAETEGDDLWQVPLDPLPTTPLYAVRRRPIGPSLREDVVIQAVRAQVETRRRARA